MAALLIHHADFQIFTVDPASDGWTNLPEGLKRISQSRKISIGVLLDSIMFKAETKNIKEVVTQVEETGNSSKGNGVKGRQGHTPLVERQMFDSSTDATDSESSEDDSDVKGCRESKQLSQGSIILSGEWGAVGGNYEHFDYSGGGDNDPDDDDDDRLDEDNGDDHQTSDSNDSTDNSDDDDLDDHDSDDDGYNDDEEEDDEEEDDEEEDIEEEDDEEEDSEEEDNEEEEHVEEEDEEEEDEEEDVEEENNGGGNDPTYWMYYYTEDDYSGGKSGWYWQKYEGRDDELYHNRHKRYLVCERDHLYEYRDARYVCFEATPETRPGDINFYVSVHDRRLADGETDNVIACPPYWPIDKSEPDGKPIRDWDVDSDIPWHIQLAKGREIMEKEERKAWEFWGLEEESVQDHVRINRFHPKIPGDPTTPRRLLPGEGPRIGAAAKEGTSSSSAAPRDEEVTSSSEAAPGDEEGSKEKAPADE